MEDEPAFDFEEEPEPAKSRQEPLGLELAPSDVPPAAPQPPARLPLAPLPEPEPAAERDDIFSLDDIDTPPILRRERKLY